jgi:hypothetical protein
MKDNSKKHQKEFQTDSCPYLGLKDDPASFSGYPSKWNACFHTDPAATPKLPFQRSFCLSISHVDCPVFKENTGQKMPREIQLTTRRLSKIALRNLIMVLIGVLILAITTWVLMGRSGLFSATRQEISLTVVGDVTFIQTTSTLTAVVTSTKTSTVSPTAEPTPAATNTIAPSSTPIEPTATVETKRHLLDTPIGAEKQLMIHRVLEGESLQLFAAKFSTSVEAITAINYNLISPLWVDWIVIIPIGFTDMSELPMFEGYQVQEDSIRLDVLAEQLSVSVDDLSRYNALTVDHVLHLDEWILVPRERQ